jgi:hypothetical protein
MTILVYYYGQKYYPIPYPIKTLLASTVLFIVAFVLTELCGTMSLFAVLAKIGICAISLAAVYFFNVKKPLFSQTY